jgi:hypothetical protein
MTLGIFPDFMHGADVWVIQSSGSACFAQKAIQRQFVLQRLHCQEFQRHGTVQNRISRGIDNTHPAAPKFVEDMIVRNSLTNHDAAMPNQAQRGYWDLEMVSKNRFLIAASYAVSH